MPQLEYTSNNQPKSTPFTTTLTNAGAASSEKTGAEISVFCDVYPCSAHATGTRKQLERRGWGIYAREEFCPAHESEI